MQIELLQKFFLNPCANTIPKENTIRNNHATAACLRAAHRTTELSHDQLQELQSRLCGLLIFGEIRKNSALLFATEGWICDDDIHAIAITNFSERGPQGVLRIDLWILKSVQQQIHLAKQVWQWLCFDAGERFTLQRPVVFRAFGLLLQVLKAFD